MVTTDVISLMRDRLVERFQPRRIILFGSHARGDAVWDSDVDLLVVLDSCPNKRRAAIAMRRILAKMPAAKDILVATPEEIERNGDVVGTVLWSALREGRVLYDRD